MGASNGKTADRMRKEWNTMAQEDAMYYISAKKDWDEEGFFKAGEVFVEDVLSRINYAPGPDQTMLEVGCGIGRTTRAFSKRFGRATGVDISSGMVEKAREIHKGLPNLEFIVGSGFDLAFAPDESVDFCFSNICFQHIPDPQIVGSYFREIGRVLKPGGTAYFQLPTRMMDIGQRTVIRLKQVAGAILEALGLWRFYREEPRHPCRWIYPIPMGRATEMLEKAGLRIERVEDPDSPVTFFLCRKS